SSNKSSTSGGSSSSSGSSSGGSSSSSSSSSSNKSSSSGGSSSSNKSSGTDVVPKKNKNGSQNYFRPPVNGDIVKIGSDFGQRAAPKTKNGKTGTAYHRGVDIKARNNTKLYAAADGIVIQASWWRGYGNVVKIQHSFTVSKKTAVTLYAHMNSFSVKKGQKVKKGQLIGYSGNTGNSGGPHLHYELRFNNIKVDPLGSKVKPVLENKKQVNAAAVTAGINYIGKKFCFKKGISSARLKKYRGNNAALKKQFPQCLGWCNSY
ncbi:MAG: M23 family metallopeptidase, partial [Alphaproteobacteria bacterium]|nr:M23 family metallopeptidase [Alphaproteobacteria bacterium]